MFQPCVVQGETVLHWSYSLLSFPHAGALMWSCPSLLLLFSFLHLALPKITTVLLWHSSLVVSFEPFTLLFMVEQRNSIS